ncbi:MULTISPECIES: hypothetical protein [Pseudoalteromonas]|jgi:hypothetical protein|uniref:hypothetical protein n=1 Tax=Pseudoalteromonas TaxID=53246 RepID=UPI000EC7E97D|nr:MULTISPECIES: hypothetical protein [unclassified Pseudoalteromonas]MCF2921647.1 hypothetical protein [Pseudoalteromonas sp. APAL1]MCO7250833.1 hypothetical protein [Pseudoalteromonas sp. Ps84H-4]HCV05416.1 hypothetical protein [Pseudoalteromonas sp.]|tara:strand:- start:13514 stop:14257 length:744 start_codon:yes stop_codon:yes gene_type:complete
MNFNFIIVFALLFTPLTSVESDFEQLTLTLHAWLNNQDEVPKHFTFSEGVLYAKKSLISGGEIHFKPKGKPCISYAPHRYFDKHTLLIAKALFSECQVLLTNTKHRSSRDLQGKIIDFSQYQNSSSNAFILAYGKIVETFSIYQIHGFAKEKRTTEQGRKADIIISEGHLHASQRSLHISKCLNSKLDVNALVYGQDVYELGGTQNILNSLGPVNSHFFHIELSRELRERLITNNLLLKQFSQCLIS